MMDLQQKPYVVMNEMELILTLIRKIRDEMLDVNTGKSIDAVEEIVGVLVKRKMDEEYKNIEERTVGRLAAGETPAELTIVWNGGKRIPGIYQVVKS